MSYRMRLFLLVPAILLLLAAGAALSRPSYAHGPVPPSTGLTQNDLAIITAAAREWAQGFGYGERVARAIRQAAINYHARWSRTERPSGFRLFAGGWGGHGYGYSFKQDGRGEASWRVYRWCSDSPPPCDYFQDSTIISGGRATLRLTDTRDTIAFGRVLTSNQQRVVPRGAVTVIRIDEGILLIHFPGGKAIMACGRAFEPESMPRYFPEFPCGA